MDAQSYLEQIRILDTKIKQKEKQCIEVYSAACNASAVRLDKELVNNDKSRPHDGLERLICKYLDLENEVAEQLFELHNVKNKIVGEIQELSDSRHVNILYKRYVEYKSYDQIAKEMGYSFDYIKELHKDALDAFSLKHPTKSHEIPRNPTKSPS